MELVNTPVPVPLLVLVASAVVGPGVVLQQTPLALIVAFPPTVIVPPLVALIEVIADMAVVVTVDWVVNDCCAPYAVPPALMAYDLT